MARFGKNLVEGHGSIQTGAYLLKTKFGGLSNRERVYFSRYVCYPHRNLS
jgi:hypothetical protein